MKELRKIFLGMPIVAMMAAAALVSACSSDDDDKTPGPVDPTPAGVVAVDLGLPSGTKWANMNVGASKAEDYGLFFAWGETVGYSSVYADPMTDHSFDWASYTKFGTFDESAAPDYGFTKYNKTNGPTVLQAADDAATANWGSKWKMPTLDQIQELVDNTDQEWTTINGVDGRKFMKKTDHSEFIFLPAAGYRDNTSLNYQGTRGYYWSSELHSSYVYNAWGLYFYSSGVYAGSSSNRCNGRTVRPVRAQ